MSPINTTISCLATIGLVFTVGSANARGIGLDANIKNVSFSVTDLTPSDGIDASYSYQLDYNSYYLDIIGPNGLRQEINEELMGLAPVAYSLTAGSTNVSVMGDGTVGGVSIHGNVMPDLGSDGIGFMHASQGYTVTLAAHSALTLSGSAFLDVKYLNEIDYFQNAHGGIAVQLYTPDEYPGVNFELKAYSNTGVQREDFSLYYANLSDQAITFTARFVAAGNSHVLPPAVPEPSTYAMLGIGLLAIGAIARRRS
jgi:PEP-CTERM motif